MNNFIVLILVITITFTLLQVIEISSIGSRIAGRYTKQLSLGYSLQQTVFTVSRALLILFLPAIALLIESGINVANYSLMAGMILLISSLMSYLVLIKLNFFQKFFQKIILNYKEVRLPEAIYLALIKNTHQNLINFDDRFYVKTLKLKKFSTSFFAYFFLSSGYFFSFLLSIIFYEHRLAFSQITPLFHGIGALTVAFYLDPMLSRSIDNESDDAIWIENVHSIMLGRVFSFFLASLLFIFIFANQ